LKRELNQFEEDNERLRERLARYEGDGRTSVLSALKKKSGLKAFPNQKESNPKEVKEGTRLSKRTLGSEKAYTPRKWKRLKPSLPFVGENRSERMKKYEAKLESNWNERFQQLLEFKAKHGHLNVPQRYEDNKALSSFVYELREKYKRHIGEAEGYVSPLFIKNIERLKEIGFRFDRNHDQETWDERVQDLISFKEIHGHCQVPSNYPENPKLANWTAAQHRNYKIMKEGGRTCALTEERLAQLEEIGIVFALRPPQKERWNMQYDSIKAYKEEHGNCRVPKNYEPNPSLHSWCQSQRSQYKNAILSNGKPSLTGERIAKLQLIGFEWEVALSTRETLWEARFRELLSFKAEKGHCRVPKVFKENIKLSNWVFEQRKNMRFMREGKNRKGLTDERITRLEEVGFEWSVSSSSKRVEVGEASRQQQQQQQHHQQQNPPQQHSPTLQQHHPQQHHPQQHHPQQLHPQQLHPQQHHPHQQIKIHPQQHHPQQQQHHPHEPHYFYADY